MKAILLDIEGTVTGKRFVTETLFPFSRARMAAFLAAHENEPQVDDAMSLMRQKMRKANAGLQEIAHELMRWIDEDRKEEPLKTLQGLIWRQGYEDGTLISHIYPDVAPALARWHRAGLRLAIFSSGSISAQKLLFARTVAGDLTPHLAGHFDLSTGPKTESASYLRIAKAIDCPPSDIRFYSDTPKEVVAAIEAGMDAVLVERDGPIEAPASMRRIRNFTGENP